MPKRGILFKEILGLVRGEDLGEEAIESQASIWLIMCWAFFFFFNGMHLAIIEPCSSLFLVFFLLFFTFYFLGWEK